MSKLALGSVQFGLNYGIANKFGVVKPLEVKKILLLARQFKINLIDTAIGYGDSEKIIGKIGILDFNFISKLPAIPANCSDVGSWVEDNVKNSLARLGIKSLHGLLLHKPKDLLGASGNQLINALKKIKLKNLAKKIGISIYDPSELDLVMHLMKIDIVQAPVNIIDRRLENSGWMSKLYKAKVEIHARSVFLQGLLLMPNQKRPNKFSRWSGLWKVWDEWLKDNKITALEATIQYAISVSEISKVIIGVETKQQLEQIITATKGVLPKTTSELITNDIQLLNPTHWNKLQY
jgi:aryl-alcohol dehydrogenase-like predicted oxidoreductase